MASIPDFIQSLERVKGHTRVLVSFQSNFDIGRPEAAQAAFDECRAISQRPVEDPSNAGWQHDLSLACLRVGSVAAATQLTNVELALYDESLRTFEALVERAPRIPLTHQTYEKPVAPAQYAAQPMPPT